MGASYGEFTKYPRTPHLFGSKGTDDDKHLGETESLDFIANDSLIIEEKIDGTNVGVHFSDDGQMMLQCRGHLITEGMHPQYDLFKQWTTVKQGTVIQLAKERCRELMRKKTSFAFNATNTMRKTRGRWIDLFCDYGARIDIVYVEPPFQRILKQNKERNDPVPEQAIQKLADKCEPPTWLECHSLRIVSESGE